MAVGLALFAAGRVGRSTTSRPTITDRVDAWQHPFDAALYDQRRAAATRSPSRSSRRPTAGCSGQGFGQALLERSGDGDRPAAARAHTDLIYAVIVNELGLVGACAVLCIYLLVVERGFKIAMLARDSFSKLLATGLTAVFALQVFVIVGGVTQA